LAAGQTVGLPDLLTEEGFVAYYGTPLIAKGQVKGVLEIYHRLPLEPDAEWVNFFETLAGQAAIAIDNAGLFESLQRANLELTLAYDRTLEGWVRALDLRDKETLGHTQRVTDMTLRLARAMSMGETVLLPIRRGALLHDIGKMGIPDRILHKPGPLTDDEWAIMRKHPEYAYELLSPIEYLRQALEIPYCHHERWDGTGYPRGLKGEEIPLAARIFSIVDVWDALLSNRPYRRGCTEVSVLEYIRKHAGTSFDARLVEAFLELHHKGIFRETQTDKIFHRNDTSGQILNGPIP
jgi:HD-GYP domain-containing protein (c-di-GMP phosphodiesterase class II)